MNMRSTVWLAGFALALGLYVYFFEVQGKKDRLEEEAVAKRLLSFEIDEVTMLDLPLDDADDVRLVRDPNAGAWRIDRPVQAPADASYVDDILENLRTLASESVIENPPEDLSPFGLTEERSTVRVWTGGEDPQVVHLGGPTPLGSARYAIVEGGSQLFTVASSSASPLEPGLFGLRDKRVIDFETARVKTLRIRKEGEILVVAERQPAGEQEDEPYSMDAPWRLLEPSEGPADGERIGRLLVDLAVSRATGFVDAPGELADYGLEPALFEVELETQAGKRGLHLGRAGGKAYAGSPDGSRVFEVNDRFIMNLPSELFAYRHKRVIGVDGEAVQRVELLFPRDGTQYAFVDGGEKWLPDDATLSLRSFKIDDVLYAIEKLDGSSIIEKSTDLSSLGLEPARVRVRALDADGQELGGLELGDPDPELGIAARSSSSENLWRVEQRVGEDIPLGEQAFRNGFLEVDPNTADSVEESATIPAEESSANPD